MSARSTHKESLLKREAGYFEEALQLNVKALIKYQEENDTLGFAEAIADQTITLRHLYRTTGSEFYLILAKHQLKAAIEIAEKDEKEEALAQPLFNLAKVYGELEDYQNAIESYKKALEIQLQSPSQRPAIVADVIIHMSHAEYKNGDKSAKERLIAALTQLEGSTEDKYNKLVWISGAHLYLADMLKEDEFEKAKNYLDQAKEIIDSDDRLILRKEQWKKLAETLNK